MTKIKVTTLNVRMWSDQCCHTLLIEMEKWGIALAKLADFFKAALLKYSFQIIKFIHFMCALK